MTQPVSRQYARILARRSEGLCLRCPDGRPELNRATGLPYTLCASCRAKKNAQQAQGPREERL